MHLVSTTKVERGAEIIAFDQQRSLIYTTGANGVSIYHLRPDANLHFHSSFTFSAAQEWEPTSIAFDPAGRGFVVVSWIPTPSNKSPGMLQVIDASTQLPVWQLPIGNHPDCISFTPDGQRLIIANEAEPGDRARAKDQPGAITILDLSMISSPSDFQALSSSQTYQFTQDHFASGVSLESIRISAESRPEPELDIEPEYLATTNSGVWVSLQENNALAYFDFHSNLWTTIKSLGSRAFPMDLLDNEQIKIQANPYFQSIHQPDTIARFETNGSSYILLANEGEGGDTDTITLSEAIATGLIDQEAVTKINAAYSDEPSIGKLRISTIDGDTDHDGDIDIPTTLGTRGISIHDSQTGEQLWDSGPQLELISSLLFPKLYNHNDTRSDRSGPEPEGLAIGYLDDRVLGFVGLERTHAIFMYDLTDPTAPKFLDAQPLPDTCNPEGLKFIQRDGRAYLIVAAEGCNELRVFEVK